ncbi:KAP family P-loop NTPase fold protein [Vibrio parahaemolyticus]|uniref:KAP family P-loop NTPase fold protein n=7 Tax=Vibrio parahaemolyticus TaxID=670 RepID=UPI0003FB18DF|nr:P-loop NTPase fold protein [Vibrio parahaemolyticus]EIQ7472506.1 hypothetical protein [Vibrio parahaemolyticus]HCE3244075.1 hypothetical protein [Vibrio parahaemolyticus]
MKLVVPTLKISADEGFERDMLDRQSFGESLKNIVLRSDDELVISLDGKWGEGKSTFVRMWQGLLNQNDVPNIYIDSFANDYVDDPFLSVASAITSYVEANAKDANSKKIQSYKDTAKNVGVKLISLGTKMGVKALTLGAINEIDISELQAIKDDIANTGSDALASIVEEKLSSYNEDIELFESFKTRLSDIPKEISGNDGKPLVVIIDELDRCRPTYAVELIEKVKHLFSVKNVVFLLVMHRQQLEVAVKSVYGPDIDAHTYLQKFINLETTLPRISQNIYSREIDNYCDRLYYLHELETWNDKQNLQDYIVALSKFYNLSLRQLERVYTNLAIFYASCQQNQLRIIPVLSILIVTKVINPDLLRRLDLGEVSIKEFKSESKLELCDPKNHSYRRFDFINTWFEYLLMTEEEMSNLENMDRYQRLYSAFYQYNIEREHILSFHLNKINLFSLN